MPRVMHKDQTYYGRVDVFPFTKEDYLEVERLCLIHRDRCKPNSNKYRKWYRNYIMLKLGVNTGFRIEVILQLMPKQLNGGKVTVKEFKTNKSIQYELNPSIYDEVKKYIDKYGITDREYIFSDNINKMPITSVQAWRIIKKLSTEAGIEYNVGCHSLRKSYARWFYDETHDLLRTQQLLKHSNPLITLQYICLEASDVSDLRRIIHY